MSIEADRFDIAGGFVQATGARRAVAGILHNMRASGLVRFEIVVRGAARSSDLKHLGKFVPMSPPLTHRIALDARARRVRLVADGVEVLRASGVSSRAGSAGLLVRKGSGRNRILFRKLRISGLLDGEWLTAQLEHGTR